MTSRPRSLRLTTGSRADVAFSAEPSTDVLGHASIAITKDVYGHLMEGDKRAAAEAISGALLGRPVSLAPGLAPTDTEETG